jgi:phage/plasmid-associated DNA primase
MKKTEYYIETLRDLENEVKSETRLINSLGKMKKQLQSDGYDSVDALEKVISTWENRRRTINETTSLIKDLLGEKKK